MIGFLEGSFIVVAVEPLLIPMMLSRGRTLWLLALCPALGNIIAGLLMYWLGATMAEPVIEPLTRMLNAEQDYADALERLREHGFLALFLVGITPFPFQLGAAAAGAAGYPLLPFVAAVALSRGLRYLALAALVRIIGVRIQTWLEKYELEIFIGGTVTFSASPRSFC
ncbi:MAG: VTT domain-containing protein [Hyphomonadaceae bacterium]